jgi:tRNA(Ile)-lysidine synthetase-like protein
MVSLITAILSSSNRIHPYHFIRFLFGNLLLLGHVSSFAAVAMKRTCTNNVLSTTRRRFGGRPILQQQQQQPFIKHITTKPAVFSTYSIRHLWSCRGGGGGNVLSRTYPTSRTSSLHSTTRTVCSSWHDNDQENNNNNNSADEEAIEDTDTKNIRFLNQIRHSLCQDILSTVLSQQVSDLSSSVSNQRNDPPPSCVVLLSVSGGCDSVALLHSMMELVEPYRNERGDVVAAVDGNPPMYPQHCFRRDDDASNNNIIMELHVVHFDHCQRGEASDGDRRLVEHLAQSMGLAFHCFYWHDDDDDDYNKNSRGAFTQEVARTWRISKLSQLLQSLTNHHHPLDTKTLEHTRRPGVILTAHHQDDSNETLLLKLLRGVHLSNLSGMEPLTTIRIRKERHDDDDDEEEEEEKTAMFGRPMLRVKKSSIVDFLQSRQYTWREDASNQSDKYLRNRVRNELVPLLTDLVGGDDSLQVKSNSLT